MCRQLNNCNNNTVGQDNKDAYGNRMTSKNKLSGIGRQLLMINIYTLTWKVPLLSCMMMDFGVRSQRLT